MTTLTCAGSTPLRSIAARNATCPSSAAVSGESAPRNLPIGVRAPLRITASRGLLPLFAMLDLLSVCRRVRDTKLKRRSAGADYKKGGEWKQVHDKAQVI